MGAVFGQVHAGHGVTQGDALVEGGERAELDAPPTTTNLAVVDAPGCVLEPICWVGCNTEPAGVAGPQAGRAAPLRAGRAHLRRRETQPGGALAVVDGGQHDGLERGGVGDAGGALAEGFEEPGVDGLADPE